MDAAPWLEVRGGSSSGIRRGLPVNQPPFLRKNNGTLQVRLRIDGCDGFINRLGRWNDPVAVAKAHAIAAQIWSDYQQGSFDRSLMAYQPLVEGKQVCLLEALRVRAEQKRHAAAIHACRLLEGLRATDQDPERGKRLLALVEAGARSQRLHHCWSDNPLPPVQWGES